MSDSPKKTVRLPFGFGEIVYMRSAKEKVPGLVTSFRIFDGLVMTCVSWTDTRIEQNHCFYELTTEYQPDFSSSE
jgi:hypothetical protein